MASSRFYFCLLATLLLARTPTDLAIAATIASAAASLCGQHVRHPDQALAYGCLQHVPANPRLPSRDRSQTSRGEALITTPLVLADLAAAISASAAVVAAGASLIFGFVYTRQATELTRRAAMNARVSAQAAVDSARIASDNLALVAEQLGVLRDQTAAVHKQVELGLRTLGAQDRPALDVAKLAWDPTDGEYSIEVINRGRGTAWITSARLVMSPPRESFREAMRLAAESPIETRTMTSSRYVLAVDQSAVLAAPGETPALPPSLPALFWIVLAVRDFSGAEVWTYFFVFRALSVERFTSGITARAAHAIRGNYVTTGVPEVAWPLERLDLDPPGMAT